MAALPFLGANKGDSEARYQLLDLANGIQHDVRRPVHVQDQPRPQTVCPFQPVAPLQDHPGFVVQPFHGRTGLPGLKVVQDLLLPRLEGPHERVQFGEVVHHVQKKTDQRPMGLVSVLGCVKDPLEAPPQLVQRPQPRQLTE